MDLADVMQEVADRLDTITGLRVYAYPPDQVQVPAAIVDLPEAITYDETYGRGTDRIALPVDVLVGRVSDRASRDLIAPYFDGDGARSVKAVLETGDRPPVPFTGGSRSGFVATLTGLPAGHGFKVGASVVVDAGDNTFDSASAVLVGVGDTTVSYPQILGNDPDAGSGTVAHVPGGAPGYTAFDTLRVTAADPPFAVWLFAGVAYLAGAFVLDIAGDGAP